MAKLLKMLWEYMDLTVLPFFETWSAHIFGGWQRVCWCTNEAFNQASPTKEFWENCPQKKGGHIYGKNEGWAYLRKLLYIDDLSKTELINYPDNCQTLDLTKTAKLRMRELKKLSSNFILHQRTLQSMSFFWGKHLLAAGTLLNWLFRNKGIESSWVATGRKTFMWRSLATSFLRKIPGTSAVNIQTMITSATRIVTMPF